MGEIGYCVARCFNRCSYHLNAAEMMRERDTEVNCESGPRRDGLALEFAREHCRLLPPLRLRHDPLAHEAAEGVAELLLSFGVVAAVGQIQRNIPEVQLNCPRPVLSASAPAGNR